VEQASATAARPLVSLHSRSATGGVRKTWPRRGKQPVSKSSGSCSLSAGCGPALDHHWEVAALLRHHHGRRATGGCGDGIPAVNRFALVDKARPAAQWPGSSAPVCSMTHRSMDWRIYVSGPTVLVFQHPASWLESSLGNEIVIDLAEGAGLRENLFAFEWRTWHRFASPLSCTAGASLGSDADDRSATG